MTGSIARMGRTLTCLCAVVVTCAAAHGDVFEVTLEGFEFIHEGRANMEIELTIRPGDTVRWIWVTELHNVVSGVQGEPGAGDLFFSGNPVFPPSEFVHTFTDPGVFDYFCDVHAFIGMTSFVTVCDPCDMNCDGDVNAFDIEPFLTLLFEAPVPCDVCTGDVNGDGVIDAFDIEPFSNRCSVRKLSEGEDAWAL